MMHIAVRLALVVPATLALLAALASLAAADKRVALVVGNSAYEHSPALTNPANDARDMAASLKATGFEVVVGLDLDKRGFDGKVREFARAMAGADTGLFFYAGHGLQVGGSNFLVPIDAKLETERDLDFEAVRLDFVLRQMELDRDAKTNIVFLDACRDNPLARNLARTMGTRSAAVGRGLAQVQTGVGTFISYSTQPGNVALDGEGRNSPFTAALAKRVVEPGKSLNAIMIDVRKDVLETTKGKQVPWDHSALTGDFFFSGGGPVTGSIPAPDGKDLNTRIKSLEEELKRKGEAADSATRAVLGQLRDRLRQIDDSVRSDQRRLMDISARIAREQDAAQRSTLQRETLDTHQRIARSMTDQRNVRAEIERLESEKK